MSPRGINLWPIHRVRRETPESQPRDRAERPVVRDGEGVIMHVCALEEVKEARVVRSGRGERGVRCLCRGEGGGEGVMRVPEVCFGGVEGGGGGGEGGEFGG
ncbi:hypothetical protein V493_07595 [Pseudogymnoascus sp. VKM F-4281 (FW-2241)]|nr:hypothetical protein V493_07595 [Pseudogymnoascus sp. VKM F-4281 (FW-2241)]